MPRDLVLMRMPDDGGLARWKCAECRRYVRPSRVAGTWYASRVAVPEWLAITAAAVGLTGGAIGATSGMVGLIGTARRARREKQDAEMNLRIQFEPITNQVVVAGRYPSARAYLFNEGKIAAKDIEITASTGFADIEKHTLPADEWTSLWFAAVPVRRLPAEGMRIVGSNYEPVETPFELGRVTLSVTWRLDGTSRRSSPRTFEHDYSDAVVTIVKPSVR